MGQSYEMVLDPTYRHLFISSGPLGNVLVVVDLDGRVVKVFDQMPGVSNLLLLGEDLYAGLPGTKEILRLDTKTLRVVERIDVAPFSPARHIVKVADRLWFSQGCSLNEGEADLVSVDLSTGLVRSHPQVEFDGCPELVTIPGQPDMLVASTGTGGILRKYNVTTGEPVLVQERNIDGYVNRLVVHPEGKGIFAQMGREIRKLSPSDLSDEVVRPGISFTTDMAISPSGRNLILGYDDWPNGMQVLSTDTLTPDYAMKYIYFDPTAVALLPSGSKAFAVRTDPFSERTYLQTYIPSRGVRVKPSINEFNPARSGERFAWSQNSTRRPGRFNAFVKEGERTRRINASGTDGWVGNIDGSTLAYHQTRRGNSDLMFYDLNKRRRRSVPARVNTRAREWKPVLSRPWLMFVRTKRNYRGGKILLVNLETRATRVVARSRRALLLADDLEGRYAVWTRCAQRCEVFRYDIKKRRNVRLPMPKGHQCGASVARNGTAYVVRSKRNCGVGTEIVRFPLRGRPVSLVALPSGKDVDTTEVGSHSGNNTEVFYTTYSCRGFRSNILSFNDARI